MTVGENVAYGLMVRKVPKAERGDARDRGAPDGPARGLRGAQPAQLSGGQRQRVALARALVNRPRVLLLDEPLGALDLKLREEMQIELKAIQREVGITFIYVTHDQEEALTMSDRLAVFNEGRIEQIGAPADVYERPATRFVAGFVGTSNLLTGAVAERSSVVPGRSPSGPRRSGSQIRRRRSRPREHGARAHPGRRLSRPRHALHRRARRGLRARRHSAKPRDVLDRGARAAGPGCPAGVEETARSARRRRRLIAGFGGGENDEDTTVVGADRGGRDHRLGVFERRCVHGAERAATSGAASQPAASAAARRRPVRRQPPPGRACRPRPSSGAHKARRSTSWPGRATSRTARPTRPSTGSPTSRRRAGAPSSPRHSGPRMRRTRSSRRTPSSST